MAMKNELVHHFMGSRFSHNVVSELNENLMIRMKISSKCSFIECLVGENDKGLQRCSATI